MDDNIKISLCLTCLVANRLKACSACSFNIGLDYKPAPIEAPIEAPKNSVFSQPITQKEIKSHETTLSFP